MLQKRSARHIITHSRHQQRQRQRLLRAALQKMRQRLGDVASDAACIFSTIPHISEHCMAMAAWMIQAERLRGTTPTTPEGSALLALFVGLRGARTWRLRYRARNRASPLDVKCSSGVGLEVHDHAADQHWKGQAGMIMHGTGTTTDPSRPADATIADKLTSAAASAISVSTALQVDPQHCQAPAGGVHLPGTG